MLRFLKNSLILAILVFWVTMMTWLVRANWREGNAPFSEMSPLLVFQQVLKHEVASNLGIFQDQKRIGSVTITPLHNPANAVSLDGNIAIAQEGEKTTTYNFSLRFDLATTTLQPETVTLRLSRRQPSLNALIEVLLLEKKVRYTIKNGDLDLGAQELPLSGSGLSSLAPMLAGFPPLPMEPASLLKTMECQANRASLEVKGERMDGYRVKFSAAGLTANASLGQLGEIFVLKSSVGYHLLAEGMDPASELP